MFKCHVTWLTLNVFQVISVLHWPLMHRPHLDLRFSGTKIRTLHQRTFWLRITVKRQTVQDPCPLILTFDLEMLFMEISKRHTDILYENYYHSGTKKTLQSYNLILNAKELNSIKVLWPWLYIIWQQKQCKSSMARHIIPLTFDILLSSSIGIILDPWGVHVWSLMFLAWNVFIMEVRKYHPPILLSILLLG